jgi:hypothetical protein
VGAIAPVEGDEDWLLAAARGFREELFVPAKQTTGCAFAGPGLHRLYITTATEHWTDEQRRAEPGAGIVYAFDTDATGRPAESFRLDPTWWATVIS